MNALVFNGLVWVNILIIGTEVETFQALLNSKNVHLHSDVTDIQDVHVFRNTSLANTTLRNHRPFIKEVRIHDFRLNNYFY